MNNKTQILMVFAIDKYSNFTFAQVGISTQNFYEIK